MAKDLGVSMMVVQNVLNAYSVRHDLRISSNTSTSDLESMASLAKDDPKAAKALLRARAEGKIGGRDLEKAGPTVRAHATPAARAQAVQEILHAKKQADVRRSIDQTFGAGHYDKMYGKKRAAKRP